MSVRDLLRARKLPNATTNDMIVFEERLNLDSPLYSSPFSVLAAMGSKTALIRKFRSVGDLLSEFAKATRRLKLKAREHKAKSRPADFKDPESTETMVQKSKSEPDSEATGSGATRPAPTQIRETHGTNEAVWTVDGNGRPISVEATLKSTNTTARSSTEKSMQCSGQLIPDTVLSSLLTFH